MIMSKRRTSELYDLQEWMPDMEWTNVPFSQLKSSLYFLSNGQQRARNQVWSQRTQPNDAQGLPSDAGSSRGHFPDLLHALDPRALAQGLVQPGGSPVQVQDVAHGGICRFFYGGGWHVTHGDPCRQQGEDAVAKQCLLFPFNSNAGAGWLKSHLFQHVLHKYWVSDCNGRQNTNIIVDNYMPTYFSDFLLLIIMLLFIAN